MRSTPALAPRTAERSQERSTHADSRTPTRPRLPLQVAGNQQALRALGISAKLTVSQPGDPEEQEADRAADAFASGTHIARACSGCGSDETLARSAKGAGTASATRTMAAHAMLGSSAGTPLALPVRRDFERFFDADLSTVRVHAGNASARAAAGISAHAFTSGEDVAFGPGEFRPESRDGRRLIAHELTHVLQHRQRPVSAHSSIARDAATPTMTDEQWDAIVRELKNRPTAQPPFRSFGGPQATLDPTFPGPGGPGSMLSERDLRRARGDECKQGACHMVNEGFRRAAEERDEQRREEERQAQWEQFHVAQHDKDLAQQASTLAEDIQTSELTAAQLRMKLFDQALTPPDTSGGAAPPPSPSHVTPEMRRTWARAQQAVFLLEPTLKQEGAAPPALLTAAAKTALPAFYEALGGALRALDEDDYLIQQMIAESRAQAQQRAPLQCPQRACHAPKEPLATPQLSDIALRAFATRRSSLLPVATQGAADPLFQPFTSVKALASAPATSATPAPVGARERQLAEASDSARAAFTVEQWRGAIAQFRAATRQLDALLVPQARAAGGDPDMLDQFKYATELLQRQREFREAHPDAVKIQAIFYPEHDLSYEPTAEGTTCAAVAAKGIPWQFYLTHTPVDDPWHPPAGFEWQLHDITAPVRENRTVKTSHQMTAIEALGTERLDLPTQGKPITDVDPPHDLFEKLDDADFFPKGILYWHNPKTGTRDSLRTTEPWSLSKWLMTIGMTLAILGSLIFAPFSTPMLIAVGLGTVLTIAGRIEHLAELERKGLLTEADVHRFYWDLGMDILSALTLGMGRVVQVSRAAGTFLRGSALARSWFLLRRAKLVTDVVQIGLVAHDFVTQYRAIQESKMDPKEKEAALAQLTLFATASGFLSFVSLRSEIKDLSRGGGLSLEVDPQAPKQLVARTPPEAEAAGHLAARPDEEASMIGSPARLRNVPKGEQHTAALWSDGRITRCTDPACPLIVQTIVDRVDAVRPKLAEAGPLAEEAQALLARGALLRTEAEALAGNVSALTQRRAAFMAECDQLEADMAALEARVAGRRVPRGPAAQRQLTEAGATTKARGGYKSIAPTPTPIVETVTGRGPRPVYEDPPAEFFQGLQAAQARLTPANAAEEGRALAASDVEIQPGVLRRTQTISGQTAQTQTPRAVGQVPQAQLMGHIDELEAAGALSPRNATRMRMDQGRQLATHAEVQNSVIHPNQPRVVNRPMCTSCWEYFQAEARFWNQPQTVADPEFVRVFYPDGTIRQYSVYGDPVGEFGIRR